MKRIWLILVAILGVTYMYNSLVLPKACRNIYFLHAAIGLLYLYKKTLLQPDKQIHF